MSKVCEPGSCQESCTAAPGLGQASPFLGWVKPPAAAIAHLMCVMLAQSAALQRARSNRGWRRPALSDTTKLAPGLHEAILRARSSALGM